MSYSYEWDKIASCLGIEITKDSLRHYNCISFQKLLSQITTNLVS